MLTRRAAGVTLLLVSIALTGPLAAAPAATSQFGAGAAVLLALGLAAVGLTLFLNPFGAIGLALFAASGLANVAFLVRSSLADNTERIAGSIVGFVVLIVLAAYRTPDRIAAGRS